MAIRTASTPVRWRVPLCLLAALLLAALLSTGCASSSAGSGGAPGAAATRVPVLVPFENEHALLLLMADRRLFEPLAVAEAYAGDDALRTELALVLGRLGDVRGIPSLERLLRADSAAVRRAAAFGLGELAEKGHRAGRAALEGALLDADREVGRLAVEALWKHGATLEEVVARLIDGAPDELLPRLLPSLYRFASPGVVSWAEQGLEAAATRGDDEFRRWSAYALGRDPLPESAPLLRSILDDADPWIRGWAARGLGRVGDRFDLDRLRPLLADADEGPVIQALRAGKRLVDAGTAAPPDDWRPLLRELLTDARPGVRVTAIEAAAAWLLDDDLAAVLLALGREGAPVERELALLSLAAGEDDRGLVLLAAAASDPLPSMRAAAVRAAGLLGELEVIARLLLDEHPLVRRRAVDTLLLADPPDPSDLLNRVLADVDPTVRALALEWGGQRGLFEVETLGAAWQTAQSDTLPDARLEVVRGLAVLALAAAQAPAGEAADPSLASRGRAATERLQEIARRSEWLVRREAISALRAAGATAPALGAQETGLTMENYRDIVRRTREARSFDIETRAGIFTLELACAQAPMTCLSFSQLAAQGFFDGLSWHRVVPDFVVQGGDPRGDGQGGPGYALRDEVGLLRFGEYMLGMAHSGPDTAGSQFFVTLSAQPHLDGAYTAFGRVVAGKDVLPRLLEGDLIVRVRPRSTPAS